MMSNADETTAPSGDAASMFVLDEFERRVLGSLMEKSATQSQSYPLTINQLVSACNQKSNRNPVMDLDEDAVWSTLRILQERSLVTRILPEPGSRADHFRHNVERCFSWQSRQRAVMAELMLRGPQTPGELRTRAARMASFDSLDDVSDTLNSLAQWEPALVRMLPRGAGQSAVRFDHLLYAADEQPAEPASVQSTRPAPLDSPAPSVAVHDTLVVELTKQIAELRASLSRLSERVERLEQHPS